MLVQTGFALFQTGFEIKIKIGVSVGCHSHWAGPLYAKIPVICTISASFREVTAYWCSISVKRVAAPAQSVSVFVGLINAYYIQAC